MTTDTRRRFVPSGLLALAAALVLLVGTPYATGGFTTTVTNKTNTAVTAVFSCKSPAVAAPAYLAYPLGEANGTVATDVSGTSHPGTYTSTGVTYGVAGPCPRDGAKAVTLDGAAGYVYSDAAVAGPETFSEEVWFNTSTTTGGRLIGFGDQSTTTSTVVDRHIYMTSGSTAAGGRLVFGVAPGGVLKTITSPKNYNDNKWHQVVATLAPSGGLVGMRLYVDGAQVVYDPAVTSAQTSTGFWRVGYDSLNNWPSRPTSDYFRGSVAWAQVYSIVLTAATVRSQYVTGSR